MIFFIGNLCIAQHFNTVKATLSEEKKEIGIQQEFQYFNNSKDTLTVLYFNAWANAYADKNTALAKRFAEEFKKGLHLAKEDERGSTKIISAVDYEHQGLDWSFTPERDILKITLNRPLPPNSPLKIYLTYRVKLPSNNFTTYGYGDNRNYYLKDWYLTPAVYSDNWHLYSNKNLEDLYTDITDTAIEITLPRDLFVVSNFY